LGAEAEAELDAGVVGVGVAVGLGAEAEAELDTGVVGVGVAVGLGAEAEDELDAGVVGVGVVGGDVGVGVVGGDVGAGFEVCSPYVPKRQRQGTNTVEGTSVRKPCDGYRTK